MAPLITDKIRQKLESLTKGERAVAAFLSTHLKELPFLSAARIAEETGVSQMTVSRALRSIGYQGLDEIKRELNSTLHHLPWLIGDRYRQFTNSDGDDKLSISLDNEIKALIGVYELARGTDFRQAAQQLAEAESIFVAGFQTVRGVAADFAQRLEYVRGGVRLLTGENGTYAEAFAADLRKSTLVIVDIRRYSRQSRLLAAEAGKRGINTVIVADSTCYWASAFTEQRFLVKTDIGTFWDSNAPLASFLNLLAEEVIGILGPAVAPRIEALTELQDSFEGFED